MPRDSIGIIELTSHAPAFRVIQKVFHYPKIELIKTERLDENIFALIFKGEYKDLNEIFIEIKLILNNGELFSECIIKNAHLGINYLFLKGN